MQCKFEKTGDFPGKKGLSQKSGGFSLLEVVISLFIFVLMMITSVSIFVSSFHARNRARESQKSLEDARTTMEMVAKNMRMSTKVENIGGDTRTVRMFNNSQQKCIAYKNDSADGSFQSVMYDPDSNITTDPSYPDCSNVPTFNLILLSSGADFEFFVTKTSLTAPKVVGKATIRMRVVNGNAESVLQTSVSFRDYKEILY